MSRQLLVVVTAVVAVSGALIVASSSGPDPAQRGTMIVTMHASPSVESTIVASGGALQYLVLWRGTPGWGTGKHNDSNGGGDDGSVRIGLNRGSISLDLWLSPATHQARLQDKVERVPDGANVLFVDHADGPRPAIVRTLSIDAGSTNSDPRKGTIAPLLKRSPEIVAYLRCDLEAPQPAGTPSGDAAKLMAIASRGFCEQLKSQH